MFKTPEDWMRRAIEESRRGYQDGHGGPFGAVVVRDQQLIAVAHNEVLLTHDPTAHAEVVAIRRAAAHLGQHHLQDCELYTSCEPCPMCLGAILWARLRICYFANTRQDAAAIGFDDEEFYRAIEMPFANRPTPMIELLRDEANTVFSAFAHATNKQLY